MSQANTLVIGLGLTGLSIVQFLVHRNESCAVFDTRAQPAGLSRFQEKYPNFPLYLAKYPPTLLPDITEIIVSPGVSLDIPLLQEARLAQIPIISDIELFKRHVQVPIVAITGTNGKSTVTMMIAEMLKACGLRVGVGGNIGKPVMDMLVEPEFKQTDVFVLEVSSFQLEVTHGLGAAVAVFLNLSDDHLDRHQTIENYANAKQRIYQDAQHLVYNQDDSYTYPNPKYVSSKTSHYTIQKEHPKHANQFGIIQEGQSHYLAQGEARLIKTNELSQQGLHNALNALASLAVVHALGLSLSSAVTALKGFKGLPHRCQLIRNLNHVRYINDSKGTNVGSTLAALEGLGMAMSGSGKIILIAGGQGKGADFTALQSVVSRYVKALILIGEDASLLAQALKESAPITQVDSLESAVYLAQEKAKPDDLVLLSPACASFDWFDNFNHRGEVFTQLVEAL